MDRLLPPAIERVVRHCLEKTPEERFQSARDVAFDLEALMAVTGPTAPAHAFGGRLPAIRWRRLLGPAAALALAAAAYALGRGSAAPAMPELRQLTFRRGTVHSARFAPDGETILYSAAWDGLPVEVFSTRPGSPEARSLGLPKSDLLAISSRGEMALSLGEFFSFYGAGGGTLARAPLAGGTPREVAPGVQYADWAPDGEQLAVVREAEGRSRLEFPLGRLVHQSSGWISHPRVSLAGDQVAFLEHPIRGDDSGELALVSRDGRRRTLSAGWSSLQGLAWAARGRELWFTAERTGVGRALRAVTLDGRERLVARVAGPLTLEDVAGDGRALLVHARDRVGVLFGDGGGERDLSWLDRSIATALSSDGRTLLFYESGDGGGPRYGVYLRGSDGSPAVRLGDGMGTSLSPDGRWAAAIVLGAPPRLALLPTGVGEAKQLERGPIEAYHWATFFPDGRRLLVAGSERGRGVRLYVQDLDGGAPVAFTGDGLRIFWSAVSPDGRHAVAFSPERRLALYPIDGGPPQELPGQQPGDMPIRWGEDARTLYLSRRFATPRQIVKLRLPEGRRELLREIAPADPAGVASVVSILTAAEGGAYAYTYVRVLSDLYLFEGLR
jgi:Tol biopolymer transport system component